MKNIIKLLLSLIFIIWAFVAAYTIPDMNRSGKKIAIAVILIHIAALFGLWGIL